MACSARDGLLRDVGRLLRASSPELAGRACATELAAAVASGAAASGAAARRRPAAAAAAGGGGAAGAVVRVAFVTGFACEHPVGKATLAALLALREFGGGGRHTTLLLFPPPADAWTRERCDADARAPLPWPDAVGARVVARAPRRARVRRVADAAAWLSHARLAPAGSSRSRAAARDGRAGVLDYAPRPRPRRPRRRRREREAAADEQRPALRGLGVPPRARARAAARAGRRRAAAAARAAAAGRRPPPAGGRRRSRRGGRAAARRAHGHYFFGPAPVPRDRAARHAPPEFDAALAGVLAAEPAAEIVFVAAAAGERFVTTRSARLVSGRAA